MKELKGKNENQENKDILRYALSEVEYYRNRTQHLTLDSSIEMSPIDICGFPGMNIDSVFKCYGELIADPYQKYPKSQNVTIRRVFEPDGHMFKMIWDNDDLSDSNDSLRKIRQEQYGIDPADRFCSFYTALYRANKIIEEDTTQLLEHGKCMVFNAFNLNDEKLKNIFAEIENFAPTWLLLRPSIAFILADFASKHHLSLPRSLKYIELQGEIVDKSVCRQLEKMYGIPTAYAYTSGTVGVAAIECKCKHLHVVTDNVYLEVIKDGVSVIGEEGEICVSGLKNHAMPIIRYMTGIKGVLLHDECQCGNNAPILTITENQPVPFIRFKDGSMMSMFCLQGAVEFTNEYMANAVKSMVIHQRDYDEFEAQIALKPAYIGWKKAVCDAFLSNIREEQIRAAKWNFIFSK